MRYHLSGKVGFPLLIGVWINYGALAADWPMLGRDATRNSVSPEKGAPVQWDLSTGRNIRWKTQTGVPTAAEPVIANGHVWIGSKKDVQSGQELPVLTCLREADGKELYQQLLPTSNNLPGIARRSGWGMNGTPIIANDRMWFASPWAEVFCMNLEPLRQGKGAPQVLWRLDMTDELGVFPAVDIMSGKGICSIGPGYGDLIYVITGNGCDWTRAKVPSPDAADLVCLEKNSGKVVWEDNSPGGQILFGEFGSPLVLEINGTGQVVAPQGDGWIRSFDARTGKLLWKFDINPQATTNRYQRNFFVQAPVFYKDRLYIAGGRDRESGEGPGRLVCLDPTKRGDLSLEVKTEAGAITPNPNSGAVWHFDGIGRSMSRVTIHDDLAIAADLGGSIYCFDALTGRKYWRHETRAQVWATPLIVDGKIYAGNEDGYLIILALSREEKLIARHDFPAPIYSSAVFANGTLYIATTEMLYAIRDERQLPAQSLRSTGTAQAGVALTESATRSPRAGRDRAPDALFVPTPHDVIAKMLELAKVKKETALIDLGSGDGRILIAAAQKYGCRARGYEIDKKLVDLSRAAVQSKALESLVTIEHEDMFTQDLSGADVITVFLYPRLLDRLIRNFRR